MLIFAHVNSHKSTNDMDKFRKLIAIEPVSMTAEAQAQLKAYADVTEMYPDVPQGQDEIARRIGDADAVLLSTTKRLPAETLARCKSLRYVGMCCSLYSPESANVDIRYAEAHGICVKGIRDYGDEGVVEYVISELVRCLHGYGMEPWFGSPSEITGLKAGIVGLGKSGGMIADALSRFGAEIEYFARGEKAWAEEKGYRFTPLGDLLERNNAVFCCLNRNTVLLHEAEFARLGNHKLLFNTGLSPAWDEEPFARWLDGDNLCLCDTAAAAGGNRFTGHPHIRCMNASSGMTLQAYRRLGNKVIANIEEFLQG